MKQVSISLTLVLVLVAHSLVRAGDEEPENMMQNGDFDSQFQSWFLYAKPEAAVAERFIDSKEVEPVVGDNVAYVQIDKGGDIQNVQFYHASLTLKKGKTYTLSLWAMSEEPRPARLCVIHDADPWTRYGSKDVTFTDSWNEYSVTFTQPVDDNGVRVDIFMGVSDADVWLDHFRLYEGDYFNDGVRELPGQRVDLLDKLATTWAGVKR